MKKASGTLRAEYDFSKGQRGRYAKRFAQGTNLVLLAPDVARAFPDSASVNDALRLLIKVAASEARKSRRKTAPQ
ncbi:MAG: hypothetical protein HY858_10055 [Candidatus Solibacter usitatus]|nr:hypothetical protein [Candidatus Solibacter usitatus]